MHARRSTACSARPSRQPAKGRSRSSIRESRAFRTATQAPFCGWATKVMHARRSTACSAKPSRQPAKGRSRSSIRESSRAFRTATQAPFCGRATKVIRPSRDSYGTVISRPVFPSARQNNVGAYASIGDTVRQDHIAQALRPQHPPVVQDSRRQADVPHCSMLDGK
jgi:hypothetical protein